MKPDRCSLCKGRLIEGKTEFVAKIGEKVVVIKDVPAYICENCGEAYYTPEVSRKIDIFMKKK
jgi:YgiT-type zinc finger domain-containing protein